MSNIIQNKHLYINVNIAVVGLVWSPASRTTTQAVPSAANHECLARVDFIARLLRLDTFNPGDCKTGRKLFVGRGRVREFEPNVANFRHLWKYQLGSWIKKWVRHTSRCRFRIEDGEGRITQQTNPTTAKKQKKTFGLAPTNNRSCSFLVIAIIAWHA